MKKTSSRRRARSITSRWRRSAARSKRPAIFPGSETSSTNTSTANDPRREPDEAIQRPAARQRHRAFEGVSFDVQPGEIFGFLGPNGAGKTTCLRILSTVLKPTSGTALVAGYDVLPIRPMSAARIGFMSGNTGIYDRMTAWELVEYFGRLYGMEESVLKRRRRKSSRRLQMDEFRDVLGSKMSTGMKQKVSIARTIIHDPPVLIFDEPTTGLDVLVARAVLTRSPRSATRVNASSIPRTSCGRWKSSATVRRHHS